MMTESRLQQECYMYFHNNYPDYRGLYFKIKNEGTNRVTGALDKATGLVSGVADSCLLVPYQKTIFIEFKTETGVQSKNQKKWQYTIQKYGYEYFIVKNLQDFKKICNTVLNISELSAKPNHL